MNYNVYETYDDNTIRITMEPEVENYFDVYGEPDTTEEREEIVDLIERDGIFTYQSEYLCPCCGSWKGADSIGMIIGDIKDSVYLPDLLAEARRQRDRSTINRFREALETITRTTDGVVCQEIAQDALNDAKEEN